MKCTQDSQYDCDGEQCPRYRKCQTEKQHSPTSPLDDMVSLRNFFAAQALKALIIAKTNDATRVMLRCNNGAAIDRSEFAETAYEYADAMLKA